MDPSHSSGSQKSQHTTQQTVTLSSIHIDEFDESYVRLWKIFREAIEPLFSNVLGWVNPHWDPNTHFKDYLMSQGVNLSQIKKSLNKTQYNKLMSPSPEDKWDITMMYALLQFSELLAGKQDEKWHVGRGSDPELSLTSLKNLRNETAHSLRINKERSSNIVNEVYELTKKTQEGLKPVLLRDVVSTEDKEKLEREIDKVFDNTQQKIDEIGNATIGTEAFEEYQRDIDFLKQKKLVMEKGLPFLKNYLEKSKSISPLDLITRASSNLKIPVEKIFTEMKLEGESGSSSVPIEDILKYTPYDDPSRLLLVKGLAGMGKTTLVKKIISDWLSKKGDINGLDDFELLLHAEFRDRIESFKDLLEMSLGDVHQKFKDNEFIDVCLALRCLVIADGYDELNDKSSKLFQDILTLKKSRKLSVIVTTRPEFEEKFKKQVKSDHTSVSTIRLEGIPEEKREEFICKYYAGLGSAISPLQSSDELLQYLRKSMGIMFEVWGLPLNLAVVTTLWMNKPEVISNITTEAELYMEFFLLSLSKLKERLEKNQHTGHLPLSFLNSKIKQFIEILGCESFNALREDRIYIPESTINNLTDFCYGLGVPVEEVTGAFLKKVTTSQGSIQYSFPHKGTMEFMVAYYIFIMMRNQCWGQSVESEPSGTVINIFERLHGASLPESLKKYQNMLILMISIFHVGDGGEKKVPEEAKIEALELLEQSGVNNKESVLKVLKNIKCDNSSTRWIAQRFKLFDGRIMIDSSNIEAYNALLRATDGPLPNRDKIEIIIVLADTSGLTELSRLLCDKRIYPKSIHINSHYRGESTPNAEETKSIQNLLTKECESYEGIWSPTFQMPPNMTVLRVRLKDLHPSLDSFCESLEKTKEIIFLRIRFSVNDVSSVSRPIPFLEEDPYVDVSDVKEEDIEKVGDILRALQPQDARRSFWTVYFPLCSLSSREEILRLLDSLKGVRVRTCILFPVDKEPYFEALLQEMRRRAEASTGCGNIGWWDFEWRQTFRKSIQVLKKEGGEED